MEPVFRAATTSDIAAMVALNAEVVAVTSPMDAARCAYLRDIADQCVVAEVEDKVVGFILVMHDTAAYENENFAWFHARLRRFAYVDRIVIGPAGRGFGLGTLLYQRVAAEALAQGCWVMAAEMDIDPPNTGSLAFHKARGFVEIGRRTYESGKSVSMQIKAL